MLRRASVRFLVITLFGLGLTAGPAARGAGPRNAGAPKATAPVRDLALGPEGTLSGQVVDSQGLPRSFTVVLVDSPGEPSRRVMTDGDGQFILRGMSAGLCRIGTERSAGTFRVWSPGSAPPVAQNAILLVDDGTIVRGGGGKTWSWIANPWTLGAITAAAISIPLILDDDPPAS